MSRQVSFIVAMVVAMAATLVAKGPTARLVVTGGGLATPITVTDANILSESNVFGGTFLGGIADSHSIAPTWPKFMIAFYVDTPAWMRQGIRQKYVVYYAMHPQTGEGFVYLPAPGEQWYQLNASTILRNGLEGNWIHAARPWAKALNTYLP